MIDEIKPLVFDRRWKLARDGFGLQRDDESGNYVHIDDALDLLDKARRRAYQEGHRDGVKEAQAACMAISASVVNHEVVRMTAAKCAFAIKSLATKPAQEPNRSQKMHEAGYTRRPSPFGCEECGMVFGRVAQLQAHDCTKPDQEGDHV